MTEPPRKTSQRYPGTLTSSTLCEEMDYVDVDSAIHVTQLSRINGVEPDTLPDRQRSPIPYSEETTSSITDINLTSPIQSIAIPIVPPTVDVNSFYMEISNETVNNGQLKSSIHGSLIIENQSAKEVNHKEVGEIRKTSRSNGKNPNRDEVNSPSVTFKIPGKEGRPIRRLSSAMDILESTKLLEKPPLPNSQSSNSMTVSPKHSKAHSRSFSQKLSSASSNLGAKAGEHSVESCYSSSQSQATNTTAGVYACSTTPTPTKNLESKLKMVKRAINRKESSLKRKVNKAQRKEKRATKTLGIVVGIFLICWVPFFSINILNAICIMLESPSCEVGFSPFFYATWLGYTNSFINPIIYTIFNTEFRRAFKSLLLGRTSGRRQRARHV